MCLTPGLEGPRLLGATDIMKFWQYPSNLVNLTVLSDSQQQHVLGRSMKYSVVQLVAEITKGLQSMAS